MSKLACGSAGLKCTALTVLGQCPNDDRTLDCLQDADGVRLDRDGTKLQSMYSRSAVGGRFL